jgi:hypothetical protein
MVFVNWRSVYLLRYPSGTNSIIGKSLLSYKVFWVKSTDPKKFLKTSLDRPIVLKFGYSEKATKFSSGRFFQILWLSQDIPTLIPVVKNSWEGSKIEKFGSKSLISSKGDFLRFPCTVKLGNKERFDKDYQPYSMYIFLNWNSTKTVRFIPLLSK